MNASHSIDRHLATIQAGPTPLPHYRESGLAALKRWGLPYRKHEDWRYTSPEPFFAEAISPPLPPDGNASLPPSPLARRIAFVNGHHQKALDNLPPGIHLETNRPRMEWEPSQQDSFEALNMATLPSLTTLEIPSRKIIEEPLCLSHTVTPSGAGKFISPHLEILAGAGSRITLLEVFTHSEQTDQPYRHNGLTKIQLAEGAAVNHIKVVLEPANALHTSKLRAKLDADSLLSTSTFSFSGRLVRNNVDIELNGEEAYARMSGLCAINGVQHHDSFTRVSHNKPRTHSRQLFKSILDDRARGVFTGKIVVARGCPGVDSRLLNKNLLLSSTAHADTRPQLEVYTDDVRCAHGATTGQISPEELFYLESRGIETRVARKILCHAFSEDIIEKSPHPLIKEWMERLLYNNFERHGFMDGNR